MDRTFADIDEQPSHENQLTPITLKTPFQNHLYNKFTSFKNKSSTDQHLTHNYCKQNHESVAYPYSKDKDPLERSCVVA